MWPERWDDERFRALNISVLNHSATGAAGFRSVSVARSIGSTYIVNVHGLTVSQMYLYTEDWVLLSISTYTYFVVSFSKSKQLYKQCRNHTESFYWFSVNKLNLSEYMFSIICFQSGHAERILSVSCRSQAMELPFLIIIMISFRSMI